MKILYAFNFRSNKWYVVDVTTGKTEVLSKRVLIEHCKSDGDIFNIKAYGQDVQGNGYSLTRLPDYVSNGRIFVYRQIVKNGQVVGYKAVTALGRLFDINGADLHKYNVTTGIVNIDTRNIKYGILKLLDNSYKVHNINTNTLKYEYDIEDYLKLFKKYTQFGWSRDKAQMAEYSPVFDVAFSLDNVNVESNMEAFTRNHKIVVSLLNSGASIDTVYTVYDTIKISRSSVNSLVYTLEKPVGYLVAYSIVIGGKRYTRDILVSNKDSKILAILSGSKAKADVGTLKRCVIYGDKPSGLMDGLETREDREVNGSVLEEYKRFNKSIQEGTEVELHLINGEYKASSGEVFKLRNDIKINSIENKYLLSKLLK